MNLRSPLLNALLFCVAAGNAFAAQSGSMVQMLLPGFSVNELPLELNNINNLRYRSDGKLYALGYDGSIWLLRDTDGDGLEDASVLFFENKNQLRGPIGLAVIPEKHRLLIPDDEASHLVAQGVVVASKGKVSAILDIDGDDVADTERIIASGWTEIPQNVDAVGIAIHPVDGSIYFCLGTAAYNNAYLLDKDGKSEFDLGSQRGTIQRIQPDLSGRETVCTGVRFAIGMEFDANNELIVTEQEGATWLPNGNPFDELLRIQPGLHYGFPPRHPKHLPNVFDEPSLFDYQPQHQSTCGLAINLPRFPGGKTFGPQDWIGDAIVCGESRGKLYRTKMIRCRDGQYLATNQLIACLGMLTVDCCVTPGGDLLVACHSGGPDWGTGPSGKGKLFRIRYQPDSPMAIACESSGPQETRITFDRPLDVSQLKNLAGKISIRAGPFVSAGDQYETIRPGYAVVKQQQAEPSEPLLVLSASVTPDGKTIVVATAPQTVAQRYAVTVADGENQTDLDYTLSGVAAAWRSSRPADVDATSPPPRWSGVLPYLDFDVACELRAHDSELAKLHSLIVTAGELELTTQLDCRGLFYPAIQPGERLDYGPDEDNWIVSREIIVRCSHQFRCRIDGKQVASSLSAIDDKQQVSIAVPQQADALIPLQILLTTDHDAVALDVHWQALFADGTSRSGPLAIQRTLVPWAVVATENAATPVQRKIPELADASWGRGRQMFYGEKLACGKCHLAHGDGGDVGPDLSNLIHRDYGSVRRDVVHPSYAMNPDFVTYQLITHSGQLFSGVLKETADQYLIADSQGKVTAVARQEVLTLKPTALSIMPEGLLSTLDESSIHDLLAFLLLPAPHMPSVTSESPPRSRSRSELAAVLAGSVLSHLSPLPPRRILLVTGLKDHGPGEHDYPAWATAWSELLAGVQGITIDQAFDWPTDAQLQSADTIIFYQKGSWNDHRATAIDRHLAKGGGLVFIHWAIEGGASAGAFAQRIGLASDSRQTKYRHGPLDIHFNDELLHPIARNFNRLQLVDESYWDLQGQASPMQVLAQVSEDDQQRPLFWTIEHGKGRIFVSIPGHYSWTFDDPLFRVLLLRGIAWSSDTAIDRFNELASLGVTFVAE